MRIFFHLIGLLQISLYVHSPYLPKFLGRLLYAYLHSLLGADELSG